MHFVLGLEPQKMNIAVVGTGYVGLVTGTCFAETGNNVVCVDIDAEKVERMRNGEVPIYEPHLDVLFERNVKAGRLKFTTDLEEVVEDDSVERLANQKQKSLSPRSIYIAHQLLICCLFHEGARWYYDP